MPEVVCTRATTVAGALDTSSEGLDDYKAATVLDAVLANADLHDRALLVDRTLGWRAYKPVVGEARSRRGKVEASAGTGIHEAVSAMLAGRDTSRVREGVRISARAVLATLEKLNFEVVDNERFTACLGHFGENVAGTADLVLRDDSSRLLIGDIKTTDSLGSHNLKALKWATQLACYANGRPAALGYAPSRDRWGRPKVDSEVLESWPAPMDRVTALVLEVVRGTADIDAHLVDLTVGAQAVELACQVRAIRKRTCLL